MFAVRNECTFVVFVLFAGTPVKNIDTDKLFDESHDSIASVLRDRR